MDAAFSTHAEKPAQACSPFLGSKMHFYIHVWSCFIYEVVTYSCPRDILLAVEPRTYHCAFARGAVFACPQNHVACVSICTHSERLAECACTVAACP